MSRLTYIPLDLLDRLDACQKHSSLAKKHWPQGIPLTVQTALKAARIGLDLSWLLEEIREQLHYDYGHRLTEQELDQLNADRERMYDARAKIRYQFHRWRAAELADREKTQVGENPLHIAQRFHESEEYKQKTLELAMRVARLEYNYIRRWLPRLMQEMSR